jgi:hypothetical protein
MKSTLDRRSFLRDGFLLTSGALGGGLTASFLLKDGHFRAEAGDAAPGAEERLKALGIELPSAPKPIAV